MASWRGVGCSSIYVASSKHQCNAPQHPLRSVKESWRLSNELRNWRLLKHTIPSNTQKPRGVESRRGFWSKFHLRFTHRWDWWVQLQGSQLVAALLALAPCVEAFPKDSFWTLLPAHGHVLLPPPLQGQGWRERSSFCGEDNRQWRG